MHEMTVNKLMCANIVLLELYIIRYSHDQFMMTKYILYFAPLLSYRCLIKNVCADKLTSETLINQ
jgi:hypothetical protein